MPVSHSSFGAFHMTFLALTLAPATASAATHHGAATTSDATKACTKAPVEIVAGSTTARVALARCDGSAVPASVIQVSALARPTATAKAHKLDSRVLERLEVVADHFRKDGQLPRIVLVPGNKPRSSGSFHASGRALDFKIEGVPNEEIVAFCKTMTDTGCGFYPTAGFVHVDVREHGIGHVSWIDVSRPGEAPKYVSSWPPAGEATTAKVEARALVGKKSADANVVAAADEPKLPPLPAAAQFAPLESPKAPSADETPKPTKMEEAPKEAAVTESKPSTAKETASKAPAVKDAARKTASKSEGRKGKRHHHRHTVESREAAHPTEQNPS
jgi:uncharacterized protein YcbK (DUF882 family)